MWWKRLNQTAHTLKKRNTCCNSRKRSVSCIPDLQSKFKMRQTKHFSKNRFGESFDVRSFKKCVSHDRHEHICWAVRFRHAVAVCELQEAIDKGTTYRRKHDWFIGRSKTTSVLVKQESASEVRLRRILTVQCESQDNNLCCFAGRLALLFDVAVFKRMQSKFN